LTLTHHFLRLPKMLLERSALVLKRRLLQCTQTSASLFYKSVSLIPRSKFLLAPHQLQSANNFSKVLRGYSVAPNVPNPLSCPSPHRFSLAVNLPLSLRTPLFSIRPLTLLLISLFRTSGVHPNSHHHPQRPTRSGLVWSGLVWFPRFSHAATATACAPRPASGLGRSSYFTRQTY